MRIDAINALDALEDAESPHTEILRDEIGHWECKVEDLTSANENLKEIHNDLSHQYSTSLKTAESIKGRADEVVEELKNALAILLKAIKEGTAKECLDCGRTSRHEAVINIEYHGLDLIDAAQAVESAETFLISEI